MKKKVIWLILSITLVFSHCASNKDEKPLAIPAGILSKEQFALLLRDLALAESAANINVKSVSLQQMDSVYAFDPLLSLGIRKSQYDSTLQFYVAHPNLYKEVYELVLEELSRMESSRNSANEDSVAAKP